MGVPACPHCGFVALTTACGDAHFCKSGTAFEEMAIFNL
jgi:hypothetical protein